MGLVSWRARLFFVGIAPVIDNFDCFDNRALYFAWRVSVNLERSYSEIDFLRLSAIIIISKFPIILSQLFYYNTCQYIYNSSKED